ncbi:MAG: hypothetical protein ACOYMA_02055 [Bacteroidia bacterium]
MAIIYLYISLYKRVSEIFKNHTGNLYPEINAKHLISFYEFIIFVNIIFKTQYAVALLLLAFFTIAFGNYYILKKMYWKITIPNNKIYKSKALLNTLFIMLTIWFVYSFYSLTQKVPNRKKEIKYYQPLPPNDPKIDTGIERYYNN